MNMKKKYVNSIISEQLYGKTIFVNLNTNNQNKGERVYYLGDKLKLGDNCPIKYTWEYCTHNNHPAIKVNFSKIDVENPETFLICLETNSCGYRTRTPIYRKRVNKSINVCVGDGVSGYMINPTYNNITYIKLNNIQLNTDYFIYITTPSNYNKSVRRPKTEDNPNINKNLKDIPDWVCKIRVRPSIRKVYDSAKLVIDIYRDIPAEDYINVNFLYSTIYE